MSPKKAMSAGKYAALGGTACEAQKPVQSLNFNPCLFARSLAADRECRKEKFIQQKLDYPPWRTGIHYNPCKGNKSVELPAQYVQFHERSD
jgi:hypothetical protein